MSRNDLMRKLLCGVSAHGWRLCGYYLYNRTTHKAQRSLLMRQLRFRTSEAMKSVMGILCRPPVSRVSQRSEATP